MSVFPSGEKTINMLINLVLPLCIRMGCGRRGTKSNMAFYKQWCDYWMGCGSLKNRKDLSLIWEAFWLLKGQFTLFIFSWLFAFMLAAPTATWYKGWRPYPFKFFIKMLLWHWCRICFVDGPKARPSDISFALTIILHALVPPHKTTAGAPKSQSGDLGRIGSITSQAGRKLPVPKEGVINVAFLGKGYCI